MAAWTSSLDADTQTEGNENVELKEEPTTIDDLMKLAETLEEPGAPEVVEQEEKVASVEPEAVKEDPSVYDVAITKMAEYVVMDRFFKSLAQGQKGE